ncbi:hypothetical protein BKA83DRAFT_4123376 [Pisolithus microcarpus]|nr:hypothetical protein BKA83DRAFT_4123376 [Pisolithus microcarpus]
MKCANRGAEYLKSRFYLWVTYEPSKPRASKDDMSTSGSINPERVEAMILAEESQDDCQTRNISGRQEDEEGYQSCDNTISHAREGIGTPRNLTIKPTTLDEHPEGIRNWHNIDTNIPSQSRGPGGQDAANMTFGDVEGKPKLRNNGKRVKMDGRKCQMDGTTSSMCCDSK